MVTEAAPASEATVHTSACKLYCQVPQMLQGPQEHVHDRAQASLRLATATQWNVVNV